MKNQPSIDPRERRANLDSSYSRIIAGEDPSIHQVSDLIKTMTSLAVNGSKKDKANHYDEKISKLEKRLISTEGEISDITAPYNIKTGLIVINIYDKKGNYVGTLGYHEQGDWQAVDTSKMNEGVTWEPFEEALKMARTNFPNPPCDYLRIQQ